MMVGISRFSLQKLSFRSKPEEKRTIIIGLKSDNYSRDILLGLLTLIVKPGDNVLAIHVQSAENSFDPNTFHIHEDLCKSKQVEFQLKICNGDSYISLLTQQVRLAYATMLVLGSSLSGPNVSAVNSCLKALPPTCTLLVINSIGRIVFQRPGTSQQGCRRVVLRSSLSAPANSTTNQSISDRRLMKSFTAPSSSPPSSSYSLKKTVVQNNPNLMAQKLFQRFSLLEVGGTSKHFSLQELCSATNSFSPSMVIGEGANSKVYRASFEDGQVAAVEVLKTTNRAAEDLLREVDLLSRIKHENIVKLIGHCDCTEMQAIVYDLLKGSLKHYLRRLKWSERMRVAVGVAKALDYLHQSCSLAPIIHRDVKSSNILLSDNFQPRLSDFGEAIVLRQPNQASTNAKPVSAAGSMEYVAPEYMMYGKVDEKTDVYSYGVVLLELITGKEAIQVDKARSLLSYGLCDRLIDPYLSEDYNKEEMRMMMIAARLCLVHSSSRRPTMKTILRFFEEPDYWLKMQREREDFLNGVSSKCEVDLWRREDSITSDIETCSANSLV